MHFVVDVTTTLTSDGSNLLKMLFAILGPFLVISILAYISFYFIRRNHRKRLALTRNKQDPEAYAANDEGALLRVTSAGDSTLRVKQTNSLMLSYYILDPSSLL